MHACAMVYILGKLDNKFYIERACSCLGVLRYQSYLQLIHDFSTYVYVLSSAMGGNFSNNYPAQVDEQTTIADTTKENEERLQSNSPVPSASLLSQSDNRNIPTNSSRKKSSTYKKPKDANYKKNVNTNEVKPPLEEKPIEKLQVVNSAQNSLPSDNMKYVNVSMTDAEYKTYENFKKMQQMETKGENKTNENFPLNFDDLTLEVKKLVAEHSDSNSATETHYSEYFEDYVLFGLKQKLYFNNVPKSEDSVSLERFLRFDPAEIPGQINSTGVIPKRRKPKKGKNKNHAIGKENLTLPDEAINPDEQLTSADTNHTYELGRGGQSCFKKPEKYNRSSETIDMHNHTTDSNSAHEKSDQNHVNLAPIPKPPHKKRKKKTRNRLIVSLKTLSDSSSLVESEPQSENNKDSKPTKKNHHYKTPCVEGTMTLLNKTSARKVTQNTVGELKNLMKTSLIDPDEIFEALPCEWNLKNNSERVGILKNAGFVKSELEASTREYTLYKNLLYCCGFPTKNKIESINRIENPFLYFMYELKKIEVSKLVKYEEKMLFHGTNNRFVKSICSSGLSWTYVKQTKETGQGITFTRNVKYASRYCRTDGDQAKCMFLSNVLLFNTKLNQEDKKLPPGHMYFTLKKWDLNFVYDDYIHYPSILINFQDSQTE